MALVDLELWDGRHTWCHGYREGLPWWRWGWAPRELRTRKQIHADLPASGLLARTVRVLGEPSGSPHLAFANPKPKGHNH